MDSLYQIVKPLGITAYSLFFITILIRLNRKKIKNWLSYHRLCAIAGIIIATIHATLVITL